MRTGADPVGLAGGYQEEPGVVELVSMWVGPRARGHGVGERQPLPSNEALAEIAMSRPL